MVKPIDIAAGNAMPPDGVPRYGYTFGGHKFLKKTELVGEDDEERLYLGGAEFVEGQPESYYHGEGRVALTGDKPAFQYKLTDHLGNTMVLFEDKDGDKVITTESMSTDPALVEVLQRNFYYAFGLPMQGPWNHAPADLDMPYLYNGKELEGELGLGWYAYGARFYDPATSRFTSIDRFAEKYAFQSPYAYAANNPIKFIDVNGDSIGVNLLNSASQEGFDAFFATNEGKTFVGQFAAKGQTVNGYTFKADGKYHTQGIDLEYSDRDFGKGLESTGAETTGGTKGGTFIEGRLKLGVSINTTAEETSLIDRVTAVTHESFLHVQEYSFDYLDNRKLDFSHDPFYNKTKNNSPSSRHHLMFHHKPNASTTHPFATKGLRVLESVNNRNNLGYSRTQLWHKIWTFWD